MKQNNNCSIIALDKFIKATRDSGYKGTVSAIAELVDNSLQARSRRIEVLIDNGNGNSELPIEVAIVDDGGGMDATTLRQALRFGGTTRFNDRSGLGRYGMGLPNASLSQAKRVNVYSWQDGNAPLHSYLDVDEIASGKLVDVPVPHKEKIPSFINGRIKRSGTVVHWVKCDRLDNRRLSTLVRKLDASLGRIFRYFIWDGVEILINGQAVKGVDPLYLHKESRTIGGKRFQDRIDFDVRANSSNGSTGKIGKVTVTFSELPVHKWHSLTNQEKRDLGIANGAGVSVVRAGREIEYGWFFMGAKRRENYDDWWRCEVHFDPALDEAFGITHTKQQIRPQEYLIEILAPEIESIAKTLNARVRQYHNQLKVGQLNERIEFLATERDQHLKPLPAFRGKNPHENLLKSVLKRQPALQERSSGHKGVSYHIVEDEIPDTNFFTPVLDGGRIIVLVNRRHKFFKKVYGPLLEQQTEQGKQFLHLLQMMLLATARAEIMGSGKGEREALARFRGNWSDALDVFLKG